MQSMNLTFAHPFNSLLAYAHVVFYPSPRPVLTVQLPGRLPWQAIRGMTNELVVQFRNAGLAPNEWANSAQGKIDLWFAPGQDDAIRRIVDQLHANDRTTPVPELTLLHDPAPPFFLYRH
jgi:hypothetical protein